MIKSSLYFRLAGYVLLIIGFGFCFFSLFAVGLLQQHSMWYLAHFFSVSDLDSQKYHDLYEYTHDILIDRGRQVRTIQFMIGCSIVGNGFLLRKIGKLVEEKGSFKDEK